MELSDIVVTEDITVLEAMDTINKNGYGTAFVCNDKKLLAVVTDGDIRRHILKNGNLNEPVKLIANYKPLSLTQGASVDYTTFMMKHHITTIPIIDKSQKIISVQCLYKNTISKNIKLDTPVVIMAGGKGSRLYPYTDILPKPLIPIGDKTIIEHIMDHFEAFGCSKFDVIVNYKKNLIRSYFADIENKRNVDFIEEQQFYGTGGGLKLLAGKYTQPFFMSNCDIIIEEDYAKILDYHKSEQHIITIVSAMKNVTIPYGTIHINDNGQVLQLKEKPSFSFMTNTGLYIIDPAFLERIPDDTFIHITDVIQNCIDQGDKVGVYPISEQSWMDMGQIGELEKMKLRLEL
jgi:dTDP-glucose pyrophosphorylase